MSPYLDLPVRSLSEACMELRGCRYGLRDCAACPFAELCPERGRAPDEPVSVTRRARVIAPREPVFVA